MAYACSPEEPFLFHPHGDEPPVTYGHLIQILSCSKDEPPTVHRDRTMKLNWDGISEPTKNMFVDMATVKDANRFQHCVEATLTKWAEQMEPGHPNRLPDGNPTYIQNDTIPVIKAYVNRVPRPGLAGTPTPPALPMAELEALDFLHHHQALPYQQRDYQELFNDIPDGFIWHPIQTLVGIRGLDHRTLWEFRAYKRFWTIHKDEKQLREVSTEDHINYEMTVIRPDSHHKYPIAVPGGFHNLVPPPRANELKREWIKMNKERSKQGYPKHTPIMYVRFADNVATFITDHACSSDVFNSEGIPEVQEVFKVNYPPGMTKDEFLGKMDIGRASILPLPSISDTRDGVISEATVALEAIARRVGAPTAIRFFPNMPKPPTPIKTGRKQRIVTAPDFAKFLEAGHAVGEFSFTATHRDGVTGIQFSCESIEKPPNKPPNKNKAKTPDSKFDSAKVDYDTASKLDAIEAKIRELQYEKENPRKLQPLSKFSGNSYNYDTYTPTKPDPGSTSILNTVLARDSAQSCTSKPATQTKQSRSPELSGPDTNYLPAKPDPRLNHVVKLPGYYFACHLNRPNLVEHLLSPDDCESIPTTGPGAKSWVTAKEEMKNHPMKSHLRDPGSKEHIKQLDVISLQQTVYYYLVISDRMRRKKVLKASIEAATLEKVSQVLEQGQRLTIERMGGNHYVRAIGAAHIYDQPMSSGLKATVKAASSVNVALTPDEQHVYWQLMYETAEY
ncbi:hypothetical protein TWF694_000980 [Orbilia ellipsospora]|uniref:Uncharacterized protein n=1 Tax=Orbilia ellipsospora TaxID=2528407 RepID=A0AAV9XWV9_9PEZI